MRVLVACEFSGTVRDAFARRGHDAWSCDLLPSETPGQHLRGDVLDVLGDGWDLVIAHPPCTHLAVSGRAWLAKKIVDGRQRVALEFFLAMLNAPAPMVCVENPVGVTSTYIRPPDQIIQPYHFGHAERKTTCLWLKNLPTLRPTWVVEPVIIRFSNGKTDSPWHYGTKDRGKDRGRERSRTFAGVAAAMAGQWDGRTTTGFGLEVKSRIVTGPRCKEGKA